MTFDAFSAQWYPGHMAKARRRLAETAKGVDFIVEVLDARAPHATHNPELQALTGGRPRFVVLAKADLAEPAATGQWTAHYRAQAAGADALAAPDAGSVRRLKERLDDALRRDLGRRPRLPEVPGLRMPRLATPTLRGLVVGMPNTGKSTLIRCLGGGRLPTGPRAGVTRAVQWVKVGEGLELCDTPGILWPRAERGLTALKLVWVGCIGEAAFDPVEAAKGLVEWAFRRGWQAFLDRYGIEKEVSGTPGEVLERIAKRRGYLGPSGEADLLLAAKAVLKEFQRGTIGAVTLDAVGE